MNYFRQSLANSPSYPGQANMSSSQMPHEYDTRFQRLEDQVTHHGRMLESQGGLLQEIRDKVIGQQAQPKVNTAATVSLVKDIMQMCALIGVLTVWIVAIVTSAGSNVTDTRIAHIEKQLDAFKWAPTVEKGN
jgi:hypothetical protein